MWSNFHTHSNYCDGKGALSDYATKAKALSLFSLGFSSHAPLPFNCSWCMNGEALTRYLTEIEELKLIHPELEIYKGLEVDFIPGMISVHQFKDHLDYSIGSIHFVECYPDGKPWEIDGPRPAFLEGLATIFGNDARAAVTRYFELTREMISTACPTLIGHMDKIKIQNPEEKLFSESDPWYRDEIKKTVSLIRDSGAIVEVNTRGLYQKKSRTSYPSPWVLELLHQKKVPITLSSDAHHPDDLINRFPETASLLQQIGFKKLNALQGGTWKQFDFNENGFIL